MTNKLYDITNYNSSFCRSIINVKNEQLEVVDVKDILEEITRLREARKWSEYDLAKHSGITQSTISTWYRKNQIPTL